MQLSGVLLSLVSFENIILIKRLYIEIYFVSLGQRLKVMTIKRDFTTTVLLGLRRLGFLCKKPRPHKYELKIKSTSYPEGWGTYRPIEAEQHNWIEMKKSSRKDCMFDSKTKTCPCGIKSLEQFAAGCSIK